MGFYLIQRGQFNKVGKGLAGREGVVDLDYMGSAEFEFGAIPKAMRRVMHDYPNYIYVPTGIQTKDQNELFLFANQEKAEEQLEDISSFIRNPHPLQEYSELEKIPNTSKKTKGYLALRTNFWWCIEIGKDWMAFLNSYRSLFEKGISYDYNEWWMKKPEEEREKEYVKSLSRF